MTPNPPHPLSPLSPAEIQLATDLLRREGRVTPTTRFVSVSLREPGKAEVLDASPERRAFVVLFDNAENACYEATLSLTQDRVLDYRHVPGVQPTMTIDEQVECEQAVLTSPEFAAILAERYGIRDMSLVMVDIWSAGYYGETEERSLRLARPLCFLRSDPTDNGYARPLESVRPIVDLNSMQVIRIEQYGHCDVPTQESNYAADRRDAWREDIRPLEITQPQGPSWTVDGHSVAWQKWSVVVGFNAREGLTLHQISYDSRSVLYRASLTEMVVPYGDPAAPQRRKNAFDVGEYGMGACANSLELGCDCVGLIHYFDAFLSDSRGEVYAIKNAICMHEEDFGILWKHTDRRLGIPEVRRSRRLVISSVSTVENYEYGFFWYFYQDGSIQFEIKLTGILSLGALPAGETRPFGQLVGPQVYAPNHQHFFNMRLDFDIDGASNCVYQVDVVAGSEGEDDPYENAFFASPTLLKTEKQARGCLNLDTARTWKIVNPNVRNSLGQEVGYKLLPGDNSVPFASRNSWWRKRAGFVENHVWVTPFREDEKYGAGDYPNQSQGGEGLLAWTDQDRPIENEDVVVWYTFSHTHLPRPEDYPVMPTAYIGFWLKPNGFFSANPTLDVPPSGSKCCD